MISVTRHGTGSRRAQRALARAAGDRHAQLAAGAAAAAGATVAAAKLLLERRGGPPRTYRLLHDEEVGDGIRRIATARADSAIEYLRGETDAELAESIHEARKDLKKLRSVLRLVRAPLGDDMYRRDNTRFREAARLLSGTRDAEVKLETLASLRERFPERFPERGLAPLAKALDSERRTLSSRAARDDGGGPAGPAARRIEAARPAIADWALEGEGFELIEDGLRRSYRRGRKRFAETAESPTAEHVHEWRKRVKDLWYHLRLVRDARPGALGKAADRAHELSDLLGDHHDLAVLRDDAGRRRGVVASEDRAALEELVERRQQELLRAAIELADKLYARKPKRFVGRVGEYWAAWR
jgi:CHAD domain-containing protein